ncbi:MAG: DUF971 domain-containing protein [Proteobacteria bacterium]|nr:DUF971 domain-containing protein [Pseudomonadota bacterium]
MTTPSPSPVAQKSASAPPPEAITIHARSRVLELVWADGSRYRVPFELMRVYSPSAEVAGHGPGQEVLQTGKREVQITAMNPVGNYAVQPRFSDGHESGIFTWEYLRHLGANQEQLWRDYEARLAAAGRDRDTPMPTLGKAPAAPMVFHAKKPR